MVKGPIPAAQKAISICQQYYVPTRKKPRMEASLSELWKKACDTSNDVVPRDKVAKVLGEGIVGTITEKSKDPPHIYIGPRRGKTQVLENTNIIKDLKLGMLVALQSKSEVPTIGEVSWIEPNTSLVNSQFTYKKRLLISQSGRERSQNQQE